MSSFTQLLIGLLVLAALVSCSFDPRGNRVSWMRNWRSTGHREEHNRGEWHHQEKDASPEEKKASPEEDKSASSDADIQRQIDELVAKLSKRSSSGTAAPMCGYAACNPGKSNMLNVHLVPHTHDDVGWLRTVDEYFYGSQHPGVQYILDTVFNELINDPAKRFIYVEMAYFTRWWNELHDRTRGLVRGLVQSGQLEFTLGGWCMNDEASTHYNSIIDQHTLGFRFLNFSFGECGRPRIVWQIDPFGHSREQASLFAQFGFDGLFFARIDYQDMDVRLRTKNMESVWMGSQSLGDQATLFTGVLYNGYGSPGGFCFECGSEPIMDDMRLEDYNVDRRVNDFINAAKDQAQHYQTNHIMMTMGSDFQYENARHNFKNYDKVIMHVNERQSNGSMVNVFYSTPACYVLAMNQLNQTYQSKSDDFFPYASNAHTFWTGYFTSRAALKGYERSSNNFLQVCKQLSALSQLGDEKGSFIKVDMLRKAMGVLQHHDGVSGTEQQHVAFDYAKMVAEGIAACEEVVSDSLGLLVPMTAQDMLPTVTFCPLTNVSNCAFTEKNNQFAAIVYNPFGKSVMRWMRFPVSGKGMYSVFDSMNNKVAYQLVPVTAATASLPDHAGSSAANELVFLTNIPPLGFSTYFIQATSQEPDLKAMSYISEPIMADITIMNEFIALTFSGTTGLLMSMKMLESGITLNITQSLMYYQAFQGRNDKPEDWSSGAYAFRPNGNDPMPISKQVMTTLVQGTEVQEVHQTFSNWATQVYRLYRGIKHVDIEYTVGHIPVDDGVGKEIISRFDTDLATDKTFYTDANGREVLKRVRDYRPTWNLQQTEPVAGNYFPVNSRIYVQDMKRGVQLTVLTDRSQGGGSIHDGQLELLIHRRLLHDDSFGVSEPLNEPGLDGKGLYIRGTYVLMLDTIQNSVALHRDLAQKIYLSVNVGFVPNSMTPEDYSKHFRTTWSALKMDLPMNVHLLTLEQWHSGYVLVRLEHYYERNESGVVTPPAQVDLKNLFMPFKIASVDETTLGANQLLSMATRLQWNVANYGRTQKDMKNYVAPLDPNTLIVMLQPMQIRTFLVRLM